MIDGAVALSVFYSLTFPNDGTSSASSISTTLSQTPSLSFIKSEMTKGTTNITVQSIIYSSLFSYGGISTTSFPTLVPTIAPIPPTYAPSQSSASTSFDSTLATITIAVPVAIGGILLVAVVIYFIMTYVNKKTLQVAAPPPNLTLNRNSRIARVEREVGEFIIPSAFTAIPFATSTNPMPAPSTVTYVSQFVRNCFSLYFDYHLDCLV